MSKFSSSDNQTVRDYRESNPTMSQRGLATLIDKKMALFPRTVPSIYAAVRRLDKTIAAEKAVAEKAAAAAAPYTSTARRSRRTTSAA